MNKVLIVAGVAVGGFLLLKVLKSPATAAAAPSAVSATGNVGPTASSLGGYGQDISAGVGILGSLFGSISSLTGSSSSGSGYGSSSSSSGSTSYSDGGDDDFDDFDV